MDTCMLLLLLLLLPGMMNAVSGDKAQDKTQGELTGLLKAMGYTQEQVYKF
jgi:cytochrome-b5 reductase